MYKNTVIPIFLKHSLFVFEFPFLLSWRSTSHFKPRIMSRIIQLRARFHKIIKLHNSLLNLSYAITGNNDNVFCYFRSVLPSCNQHFHSSLQKNPQIYQKFQNYSILMRAAGVFTKGRMRAVFLTLLPIALPLVVCTGRNFPARPGPMTSFFSRPGQTWPLKSQARPGPARSNNNFDAVNDIVLD